MVIIGLWISASLLFNMVCLEYCGFNSLNLGGWNSDHASRFDYQTPVYRGCRGSGHKRPIPSIITDRFSDSVPTRGVQKSNLVSVHYNNSPPLDAVLLNSRSVCNKSLAINDYIADSNADLIAISETWIKPSTATSTLAELTPPGYSLLHVPRAGRTGGGVALIHRNTLKAKIVDTSRFYSFEHMTVTVKYRSASYVVVVLYRPDKDKHKKPTFDKFKDEFPKLLEDILVLNNPVYIMGDFNIHVNNDKCLNKKSFLDLLDTFGLVQNVKSSTHRDGNILDLLITRADHCPLHVDVCDIALSDHYAVKFSLPTTKPPLPTKTITYRRIKAIDIDQFVDDIKESGLCEFQTDDPNALADKYNAVLVELLDHHAPLKSRTITVHPSAPRYNDEIMTAKQERRRAEKKMSTTGLEVHRQIFRSASEKVTDLIRNAKINFYRDKVASSCDNQKSVFACVQELLTSNAPSTLPESDSPEQLAERISIFFKEKISKIRSYLDDIQVKFDAKLVPETMLVPEDHHLTCFDPATEEEVRKIIMQSASKSSILDPIPTFLLKKCLDVLLPTITKIINLSFQTAKVPDCFKTAAVIPILKKIFLDPEVLNNLRPVSTLPFISKTLEKQS